MSTIILGIIDNDEYKEKYKRNNEQCRHMNIRTERIKLSLENAQPVFYYEVFRTKENLRQVHCLYEDSTLIIFNKENCKVITIILLGTEKLEEYLLVANESSSLKKSLHRCSKLHDKLTDGFLSKLTEEELRNIVEKKTKYMDNH